MSSSVNADHRDARDARWAAAALAAALDDADHWHMVKLLVSRDDPYRAVRVAGVLARMVIADVDPKLRNELREAIALDLVQWAAEDDGHTP